MSYRTRRSRDPVSSKPSSDLDSGQSLRDFRNDEIRARDEKDCHVHYHTRQMSTQSNIRTRSLFMNNFPV